MDKEQAGPRQEAGPTITTVIMTRRLAPWRTRRRWPRHDPWDTYRVAELREVGHRLHAGQPIDAGWVAAQLWDFADLLEAVGHE